MELAPLESVGIVEPLESGKNKASVQLQRYSPQYLSSRVGVVFGS